MPLVELFKSSPEEAGKEEPRGMGLLQMSMNSFMLPLNIRVIQVNGPYVSQLPPEREGLPVREVYTANIVYTIT